MTRKVRGLTAAEKTSLAAMTRSSDWLSEDGPRDPEVMRWIGDECDQVHARRVHDEY